MCAKQKNKMPGFRKGKVPLAMVKKMHAEEIEYRELDDVPMNTIKKLLPKIIYTVSEPVLADIKFNRGESFKFQINAEVLPEFTLSELKGITVQNYAHSNRRRSTERTRIPAPLECNYDRCRKSDRR